MKRTVTSIQLDGKTQMIEQESAKTKFSMRTLPLVGSFKEYFQKVKEAQTLNKRSAATATTTNTTALYLWMKWEIF